MSLIFICCMFSFMLFISCILLYSTLVQLCTFMSIICSNLGNLSVPSWQYRCQGWLGPLMGVVLWLRHNEGLVSPKCPRVTVFIAQTIITSCWIESWDPGCREDVQNATFARETQKALHSKYVSDQFLFEIN